MSGQGDGSSSPQSSFTEQERQELTDIIAAVLSQHDQPPGEGEGGGGEPPDNNNQEGHNKEWSADQIGFFDPEYEESGPVVNAGEYVFYKDVYVFIDRCKDMALLRGDEKLRTILPQCFRGAALIWHSTELSEFEKNLLRTASLAGWYEAMTHRFKDRIPVALASLQKARYTMSDARDRKDPRSFVQDIIRHSRAANLTSVQNQLTMAWNNLDLEFRSHISEPTSTTTIRKFLEDLDGQSDMWHEMARKRSGQEQSHGSPHAFSSGKKTSKIDKPTERSSTGTFNEGRVAIEAITNFMSMFMNQINQGRPYYQNRVYPNNYQNRSCNTNRKKPLQITSRNASDFKKKDCPDSNNRYDKSKKAYVVDGDEDNEEETGSAEENSWVNMANNKLHKHLRNACVDAEAYRASISGDFMAVPAVITSRTSNPTPKALDGPVTMPGPIPEFDSVQNIDSALAAAAALEAFINERVNTIDADTEDGTRIPFCRENDQYDHYDEGSDFIEKKSAYDHYDEKSGIIEKGSAVNDPATLMPEPAGVNGPVTVNLAISSETSSPTFQEFKTHKDGPAQAPRRRRGRLKAHKNASSKNNISTPIEPLGQQIVLRDAPNQLTLRSNQSEVGKPFKRRGHPRKTDTKNLETFAGSSCIGPTTPDHCHRYARPTPYHRRRILGYC